MAVRVMGSFDFDWNTKRPHASTVSKLEIFFLKKKIFEDKKYIYKNFQKLKIFKTNQTFFLELCFP